MINRYTFAGLASVLGIVGICALIFVLATAEPAPPEDDTAVAQQQSTPAPPAENATPTPTGTATTKGKKPANLAEAAQAAGCTLADPPDEGNEHVPRPVTAADYGSNPPTSGMHAPEWAPDEIYDPGNTPELGTLVHTLEHGRIDVQYKPGTPAATIKQLTSFVKGADGGYHMLLFENETAMPFAVAATAWDHLLGCPQMNVGVLTALKFFRAKYIDKGPETVP